MNSNLMNAFNNAISFARKNRWQKLILKPLKFVPFIYTTKFNKTLNAKATTFWGGEMNIILPETVSGEVYKHGYFDQEVCFYLLKTLGKGKTFVDVGAHFGFFSLLASYLVGETGKVVSVDPTPSTFSFLSQNLKENTTYTNYSLYNNAGYEKEEYMTFYDFGVNKSAYNSLFGSRLERLSDAELDEHKIQVLALPIDTVIQRENLASVDLIKIDAESAEINVLIGLSHCISTIRPSIILEIGDTDNLNCYNSLQLIEFMMENDYLPYEQQGDKLVQHKIRTDYNIRNLECYNLLFVHKNKKVEE